MESDHSQFMSWSVELYHMFPRLKSILENESQYWTMLNCLVSGSKFNWKNLEFVKDWLSILETCSWKYHFLNLTSEIPTLHLLLNLLTQLKLKFPCITIFLKLRSKLLNMKRKDWRNSMKQYCPSEN